MSGLNVVLAVVVIGGIALRVALAVHQRASRPTTRTNPRPPAAASDGRDSDLLSRVTELVIRTQFGSVHMVARKLGVTLAKAAAVMDVLEANGIVGPAAGDQARTVLVVPADAERMLLGLRTGRLVSRARR